MIAYSAVDVLQGAGNQFLHHQAFRSGQTHGFMGGDTEGCGGNEATTAVIHWISLHDDRLVAQRFRLFEAVFDQFPGNVLPLQRRLHRHRGQDQQFIFVLPIQM